MNKFIIKAGLDSGLLNYIDNETPRRYFLGALATEEDVEKFAELIVEECCKQLYALDQKAKNNHNYYRHAALVIKQHFGVEE